MKYVIETVGLESQYTKEDNDENRSRVENIREFVGAVKEFEEKADNPTLTDYLENVSLVSDLDEMDDDGGAVTMMTLHSAKGLEFPNVFMVGMEEERRVCYVGITRARERLFLSHASRRMLYNQIQFNDRSRFIDDIPARLIEDVSDRGGQSGGFSGNKKPGGNWQSGGWQQPKTSYNVAKPTGQAQSFSGWNAKSATVGGVTVQGVQRGMNEPPKVVASQAHETEKPSIYAPGDHVMHRKFGRGAVVRVSGSGSDARIMIRFDDVRVGVKELALAIAPMIRLEE